MAVSRQLTGIGTGTPATLLLLLLLGLAASASRAAEDCSTVAPFSVGQSSPKKYRSGSTVKAGGNVYVCREWPNEGWCNDPHPFYEPGRGLYWEEAWRRVGPCGSAPQFSLTWKSTSTSCPSGWREARMTFYNSYAPCCKDSPNYDPTHPTEECTEYSACKYTGDFAYLGHRSFEYVSENDLVAFFSAHGDNEDYGGKRILLRAPGGDETIEAIVADTCGDDDCNGCCTENANNYPGTGYLVDLEYFTLIRHPSLSINTASTETETICFQM